MVRGMAGYQRAVWGGGDSRRGCQVHCRNVRKLIFQMILVFQCLQDTIEVIILITPIFTWYKTILLLGQENSLKQRAYPLFKASRFSNTV